MSIKDDNGDHGNVDEGMNEDDNDEWRMNEEEEEESKDESLAETNKQTK